MNEKGNEIAELQSRIDALELKLSAMINDSADSTGPYKNVLILKRDDTDPAKWGEMAIDNDDSVAEFEDGRKAEKDDPGKLLDLEDAVGGEGCCAAVEMDGVKDGKLVKRYVSLNSFANSFPILITSATLVTGGANRWKFGWKEQVEIAGGQYKDKPGGRTSASTGWPAYNCVEANNSSTGYQGNGINVDDLPADSGLLPPAAGITVVYAYKKTHCDNTIELRFQYENGVKPACTGGE